MPGNPYAILYFYMCSSPAAVNGAPELSDDLTVSVSVQLVNLPLVKRSPLQTHPHLGHVPVTNGGSHRLVVPLEVDTLDVAEKHFRVHPLVRLELPRLPRRNDANNTIPVCQLPSHEGSHHGSCPSFCNASTLSTTMYLVVTSPCGPWRFLRTGTRSSARRFPSSACARRATSEGSNLRVSLQAKRHQLTFHPPGTFGHSTS